MQFFAITKFHGWTDEQAVVTLLSKLEGEALAVAAVLETPTLQSLVAQLRENFSPERQELASAKLQNRVQQSKETLEALALDIQKLVKRAYPTADELIRSRLGRDSFINAISNSQIREKLRDKNLSTLQQCLNEARRIQANIEIESTRAKTHSAKQVETSSEQMR